MTWEVQGPSGELTFVLLNEHIKLPPKYVCFTRRLVMPLWHKKILFTVGSGECRLVTDQSTEKRLSVFIPKWDISINPHLSKLKKLLERRGQKMCKSQRMGKGFLFDMVWPLYLGTHSRCCAAMDLPRIKPVSILSQIGKNSWTQANELMAVDGFLGEGCFSLAVWPVDCSCYSGWPCTHAPVDGTVFMLHGWSCTYAKISNTNLNTKLYLKPRRRPDILGGIQGEWEVNTITMHCVHVGNCQRINKEH